MARLDIHDYEKGFVSASESIKKSAISDRNKEIISSFSDDCLSEGLGKPRIIKYLHTLKTLARMFEKSFDDATIDDVKSVVRQIQLSSKYSPWTKHDFKVCLKKFFKWLRNTGDEYPVEVKWIKPSVSLVDNKLPEANSLISEEELLRAIEYAQHPRDKALISLLYETGARIGEIGTLKISNLLFDDKGCVVNITQGKTGARRIRIISSVSLLTTWLNIHPFRDNPDAPLWVNLNKNKAAVKYNALSKTIKESFLRAGIKKRIHPHLFRHSRATFLAEHMTEFQMNQYLGWKQGSDMPATYIHMSGKDLDDAILNLNGIIHEKEKKQSSLKPEICPRCQFPNSNDSKYCSKCAMPLKEQLKIQLQQEQLRTEQKMQMTEKLLNLLFENPKLKEIQFENIKVLKMKYSFPL